MSDCELDGYCDEGDDDECGCQAKLELLDDLSFLPLVTPRYHGSGCTFEVAVLEKHDAHCLHKKCDNPFRNPLDDNYGSFDVIGRVVYPYCDRPAGGIRHSGKSSILNDPSAFGQSTISERISVSSAAVLPMCDPCLSNQPRACCCSDSDLDCCAHQPPACPPASELSIQASGRASSHASGRASSHASECTTEMSRCCSSEACCCGAAYPPEECQERDCFSSGNVSARTVSFIGPTGSYHESTVTKTSEPSVEVYPALDDDTCCRPRRWRWSDMPQCPRIDLQCPCVPPRAVVSFSRESVHEVSLTSFPVKIQGNMTQDRMRQLTALLKNDQLLQQLPGDKRAQIMKLRKFIDDAEPAVRVSKSKKNFTQIYTLFPVAEMEALRLNNPQRERIDADFEPNNPKKPRRSDDSNSANPKTTHKKHTKPNLTKRSLDANDVNLGAPSLNSSPTRVAESKSSKKAKSGRGKKKEMEERRSSKAVKFGEESSGVQVDIQEFQAETEFEMEMIDYGSEKAQRDSGGQRQSQAEDGEDRRSSGFMSFFNKRKKSFTLSDNPNSGPVQSRESHKEATRDAIKQMKKGR